MTTIPMLSRRSRGPVWWLTLVAALCLLAWARPPEPTELARVGDAGTAQAAGGAHR